MSDILVRIREWLGTRTPDPERAEIRGDLSEQKRRVYQQQLRLLRVDAGIPDRRHSYRADHPRRRRDDA